ncbi:uncharacterized protein BDV14DRAFT_30467 [Aspergillus stella-maris]|uniref:uncharacterized protein n=1 Tax=Aspergillus stella-maris TaxID=1810926 RepID=UPI003CCCAE64
MASCFFFVHLSVFQIIDSKFPSISSPNPFPYFCQSYAVSMVSIDPVWTSLGLIRRRDIIICPRIRQLSSISLGLVSLLRIVALAFLRTGVSLPSIWLEPLSQRCEIHWGLRMLSLCSILKYLSRTMLPIMTRIITISRYFRKRKQIT